MADPRVKRYPHTILVQVDVETNDWIVGLAKTMNTSKAAVLRTLALAHIRYLEGLARQYVDGGVAHAETVAQR